MPSSETAPLFEPPQGALALPDATLTLTPDFIADADRTALFATLRTTLPWQTPSIVLFGKPVMQPRLLCWVGDPDAVYTYSGRTQQPLPWTADLNALRQRLQTVLGTPFNSVLANCYRDGRDSMGWHADNEPELGPAPVIASITLGATRRFLLRHRQRGLRHHLALSDGSLLVMAGSTQQHWQHAVPKTTLPVGERINLTFRQVTPRRR